MAKDNIPFHAVIFPAMLAGHGDCILPDQVVANEFLNFKGQKLSKSENRMIGVADLVAVTNPDAIRYYLTAIAPEGQDTDFFWEDFQTRNNSELADTLGNFLNRGFKFAEKYFEGKVPALGTLNSDGNGAGTTRATTVFVFGDLAAVSLGSETAIASEEATESGAVTGTESLCDSPATCVGANPQRSSRLLVTRGTQTTFPSNPARIKRPPRRLRTTR